MGRFIRLVCTLAVLVAGAWVPLAGLGAAQAAGTGDLVGVVRDRSGYPAADTLVEAVAGDGADAVVTRSVRTSDDGTFRIASLPTGSYRLRAVPGHTPTAWFGWDDGHPSGVVLTVAENLDTRLDRPFVLPDLSTVVGRVLDDRGQPVDRGVDICARPVVDGVLGASCVGWGWVETAPQSDGSYTVSGLPPGDYKLLFEGPAYRPRWFGGHADPADSPVVHVGLQEQVRLADTTIVLGASVTGRVLLPDGTPAYGARAEAWMRADDGTWTRVRESTLSSDGSYGFYGLPSGQVRVRAESWQSGLDLVPTWWPSVGEADAVALDVVEGATTTAGDLTFRQGGSISGRVLDRQGVAVAWTARMTAERLDPATGEWAEVRATTNDRGGLYTFRGLEVGSYRVHASAPGFDAGYHEAGGAVASVEVVAGEDRAGTDVVLARYGRVEGRALSRDGARVPGVEVTLWSQGSERWAPTSHRAVTDADGNFVVREVPAGEYRVQFTLDSGAHEGWHGPGALDVDSAATLTVVSEAATYDVNAVLRPPALVTWAAQDSRGGAVEGAVVEALREEPDGRWVAVGRSDGGHALALPGAGRYTFRFSAPHHRTTWFGGPSQQEAAVVASRPGDTHHVEGILATLGTMTGRVLDVNGDALDSTVGYTVQVFVDDPASGGWVQISSTEPSAEVTYTLRGVEDRDHKLHVQPFRRTSGAPAYPPVWIGGDDLASATVFRGDEDGDLVLPTTRLDTGWLVAPVAPPTVVGRAEVGRRLSVHPGEWSPSPQSYTYRWLRDGREVGTGSSYTPVTADIGASLTAEVVARQQFHRHGVATTAPVQVRPAPLPATTVRATATSPRPDHAVVVGRVTAAGATPVGRVSVLHGRRLVGATSLRRGRFQLIVRMPSGRRILTVRYAGTDRHLPSSTALRLRVR